MATKPKRTSDGARRGEEAPPEKAVQRVARDYWRLWLRNARAPLSPGGGSAADGLDDAPEDAAQTAPSLAESSAAPPSTEQQPQHARKAAAS